MTIKQRRAIAKYAKLTDFDGSKTMNAILSAIPASLQASLTGAQLGAVMALADQQYQAGRDSTGAEIVDGGAVWIGSPINRLVEFDDLRELSALESGRES